LRKVKELHTDLTHYHISMLAKKDPLGSYSLFYFQAREKEVHWTSTRPYISKLVKKRPVRVLIRSLVFKLMKKKTR